MIPTRRLAVAAAVGAAALLALLGPVQGLAAGLDGDVVTVEVGCDEFRPGIVHVDNGDTLRFVYDGECDRGHTVTSSGTTLDPEKDKDKPKPFLQGLCFDSDGEQPPLTDQNPTYTLDLDQAGIVVRDADGENTTPCPLANSLDGSKAVVPYHCRFHGAREDDGHGMRGAIVIHLGAGADA